MEAKTDCYGLSEHPLEYTMLPDGEYNWSCSCGESGHAADYREHWVQIIIAGVKETRQQTGDSSKLSDDQLRELILAGIEQSSVKLKMYHAVDATPCQFDEVQFD